MGKISSSKELWLHLDLWSATDRPVYVEGVSTIAVDPLVGVSPEKVALALQQICRKALTTVAIVV